MIWKFLGFVVVVWIAYIVVNWLLQVVFPLVVVGVIVLAGYLVYRALRKSNTHDVTRF